MNERPRCNVWRSQFKKLIMKKILPLLALLPGLTFADFVDFGVKTSALSSEQASANQIAVDSGFIVDEVLPETPAAKLGLGANQLPDDIPEDILNKLKELQKK